MDGWERFVVFSISVCAGRHGIGGISKTIGGYWKTWVLSFPSFLSSSALMMMMMIFDISFFFMFCFLASTSTPLFHHHDHHLGNSGNTRNHETTVCIAGDRRMPSSHQQASRGGDGRTLHGQEQSDSRETNQSSATDPEDGDEARTRELEQFPASPRDPGLVSRNHQHSSHLQPSSVFFFFLFFLFLLLHPWLLVLMPLFCVTVCGVRPATRIPGHRSAGRNQTRAMMNSVRISISRN